MAELLISMPSLRNVLLLVSLLLSTLLDAQNTVDNLKESLKKQEKNSQAYVNLKLELINEYTGSDPDSALLMSKELLPIAQNSEDKTLGKVYLMMGISYSYLAEYDKSTEYSFEAIKEAEKYNDSLTLIDAFNNIGINYLYLEDYDQSRFYFNKVRDISSDVPDSLRLGHVLNNLGMIEGYQGNFSGELTYYDSAARIFQNIGEEEGLGNIILNTGTVYTMMEQYDKATNFYDSAELIFRNLGYYSGVQNTLLSKAENYLEKGDVTLSENIAKEALRIAVEYNFHHDVTYTYELLIQIALSKNDPVEAFDYQKKYYETKEEIFNTERAQQIDELNLKYETAEKQKELLRATIEIEKKERFQLFLIVLSSVLIASAIIIIYTQRQKNRLKEQALQAELSELRVEIKTLIGKYEGTLDVDLDQLNEKLVNPLSEREYDVFKQIFSQKTNSEIAEELFVSINTVKTHLKNLYNKLGVSNRKEALDAILKV